MIPQLATMDEALSPHTPTPFPPDADATVTGKDAKSGKWWRTLPPQED